MSRGRFTPPKDPLDPALQKRQKAGKWGHEKGWAWVSEERMDELCMRHWRKIVRRVFFRRRVVVVQDNACKLRAMIRKSRRVPAVINRRPRADE